jgi:signal transduction histidine kinase
VTSRRRSLMLTMAALAVALALVGLVWYDDRETRGELVGLLREQAHALRESVAAAARSNHAASAFAATQLGNRLLDQARALSALDEKRQLSQAVVASVTARDPLLRVAVFGADGTRADEGASAEPEGERPGRGPRAGWARGAGGGLGRGWGGGGGSGGGAVIRQILQEGKDEVVTGPHASRAGGERVAAGVKRPRGGAILVTVDATEIAALEKPASLESLLTEITSGSPAIAYTVFEHAGERIALGDAPADAPAAISERSLNVSGRPVLEFADDVVLAEGETARLRLGMRLDNVQRVEQRMTLRLTASVAAASALVAFAFGLAGLNRKYGALSEKHARAEEALRRRDRLAAMGELASTVAHEVRNPLNAASMTAQRLRREFLSSVPESGPERAELEDLLSVMTSETQRIDRIVQQFLEYARPPRLAPESVDLCALVRDAGERASSLALSRGVRVEVKAPGSDTALVDPAQLREALDNLIRNAIDATPADGQVSLAVRRDGAGHAIEVRDSGRGIEPTELPKIFDLYYTTKPDGTGVGLAVTQQIVTGHGGTIEVDSKPSGGTLMTVRLPAGRDHARG